MMKQNSFSPPNQPSIVRYGVAGLSFLAAILSLWLMKSHWQDVPLVSLFLLVVIISTWSGCTIPGVLATVLAVLVFGYLLLSPTSPLAVGRMSPLRLMLFTAIASFMVWVIASERRTQRALRQACDELRRNNDVLRESERKLRETGRLANVGYWERDLLAGCIIWSEETCRIFGWQSASRVLSEAELAELIYPDDRHAREQALAEAMEGHGIFDLEYRIVRADGDTATFMVRDEIAATTKSGRPIRMFKPCGAGRSPEPQTGGGGTTGKRAHAQTSRGHRPCRALGPRLGNASCRLVRGALPHLWFVAARGHSHDLAVAESDPPGGPAASRRGGCRSNCREAATLGRRIPHRPCGWRGFVPFAMSRGNGSG